MWPAGVAGDGSKTWRFRSAVVHADTVAVGVGVFRAAEVDTNVADVDLGVEIVASVVGAEAVFAALAFAVLVLDVAANAIEVGVDREATATTVLPPPPALPLRLAPTRPTPLLLTPQPPTAPSATKAAAVPLPHLRSHAVRMMPIPPRTAGPCSKERPLTPRIG